MRLAALLRSREYPSDPACYELLEDCGRGVSATVHRALCLPTNEVVAVKKMNLERVSMNLVSSHPEGTRHHPRLNNKPHLGTSQQLGWSIEWLAMVPKS